MRGLQKWVFGARAGARHATSKVASAPRWSLAQQRTTTGERRRAEPVGESDGATSSGERERARDARAREAIRRLVECPIVEILQRALSFVG